MSTPVVERTWYGCVLVFHDDRWTSVKLVFALGHLLTSHESARRLPGAYEDPFTPKTILSEKIASFCQIMFEENFGALYHRLHLDRAIVDFNLSHLKDNIDTFMSKYRAYARSYLLENGRHLQPKHLMLPNKNEMCLALEFFLAMDGKIDRRSSTIDDELVSSGYVLHEVVRVSRRSATALGQPFILRRRRRRTAFARLQPAAVQSSFVRVPCIDAFR